jgi:hypothetical protein
LFGCEKAYEHFHQYRQEIDEIEGRDETREKTDERKKMRG